MALLLDQKTVGVSSTHLGPEYGDDKGEEKGHQCQSDAGKDLPLGNSSFPLGCLSQQDHPENNGPVQRSHEVSLGNKLTLKIVKKSKKHDLVYFTRSLGFTC